MLLPNSQMKGEGEGEKGGGGQKPTKILVDYCCLGTPEKYDA
jgi:hypothetical protein